MAIPVLGYWYIIATDSHQWLKRQYGSECWELDAMNPNDLQEHVEQEIEDFIDWQAWVLMKLAGRDRDNSAEEGV